MKEVTLGKKNTKYKKRLFWQNKKQLMVINVPRIKLKIFTKGFGGGKNWKCIYCGLIKYLKT